MSGHRTDFTKDDAEELLVESLIEKVLLQYDPNEVDKRKYYYVVFQIIPFNQTIFQVASEHVFKQTLCYKATGLSSIK